MSVGLKVIAVFVMVLALVIGVVPQFTNCQYNKSMATPASGTTPTSMATTPTSMATTPTSMVTSPASTATQPAAAASTSKPRCFYTARAEIAVAVPLFLIGAFMLMSRRREVWRLSVLGLVEGLFAILLPAVLIGVCMKNTMVCREVMAPVLYSTGGLSMALFVVTLVVSLCREPYFSQALSRLFDREVKPI